MLNSAWVYDSYYDRNTWCIPFFMTTKTFGFLEAHRAEGFVISGVYGNYAHWDKLNAGGHTNRSTHDLWGVLPAITHRDNVNRRYVPAIDYKLPSGWMDDYERWYVAGLRANRFPYIQYININGHHYHRETGYAQQTSSDGHTHEHPAPGFETKAVPLPLELFYNEVMHPSKEEPEDMPLTPADIAAVAAAVWDRQLPMPQEPEYNPRGDATVAAKWATTYSLGRSLAISVALAANSSALASLSEVDTQQTAKLDAARADLERANAALRELMEQHQVPPDPS